MPGKGDINPATGKAYAVNPSSGNWDDNYWANTVEPQLKQKYGVQNNPASAPTQDPMALTQALQKFQVEANQPAIKTLTTQKESLGDQYKKLLADVTGAQEAETTYATRAASTSLGQRGLDPNSVEGQQQFAQILDPISKSFGGLRASIGQGQIADTNTLANAIASLQAGNPATSITGAGQFTSLAQQAQLLPSQIALQLAQAGYTSGINPTQLAAARLGQQYKTVPQGQFLVNTANNSYINPSMLMQILGAAGGNF